MEDSGLTGHEALLKNQDFDLDILHASNLTIFRLDKSGRSVIPEVRVTEGALPIISDGLFSLIIMIYVSVAFFVIFYLFCWKRGLPPENGGVAQPPIHDASKPSYQSAVQNYTYSVQDFAIHDDGTPYTAGDQAVKEDKNVEHLYTFNV